jgi:hypothetical protein
MCLLELANCDREFSETVDDVRYNLIKTRFVNFVISRERIGDTTLSHTILLFFLELPSAASQNLEKRDAEKTSCSFAITVLDGFRKVWQIR